MPMSEDMHVTLLTHVKFQGFIPKAICYATRSKEALVCLLSNSRGEVEDTDAASVTFSNPSGVFRPGNDDTEGTALPRRALDLNASPQRLYKVVADVEAQPGA